MTGFHKLLPIQRMLKIVTKHYSHVTPLGNFQSANFSLFVHDLQKPNVSHEQNIRVIETCLKS